MSKIAYLTIPAHGHVNPTLPVVQELVRRGEEVIYYNTEEFRPQIERAGASFRAYPATCLTPDAISAAIQGGNLANVSVLLLQSTEALLPFLLNSLTREAPDLLIYDSTALWGKMAATLLSLRDAGSITTLLLDLEAAQLSLRDLLGNVLRYALPNIPAMLASRFRLTRRYGRRAFPVSNSIFPVCGGLNIVFTARALQPDTALIDETFRFVGPSLSLDASSEPFPFDEVGQSPLVYISMGTVHQASIDFCHQCFEAFGDYPARFIFSVGKHLDIAALGPIPANFIVRSSVPQLAVLQRADAFITHGGLNSIHEALYNGVPLAMIPHQLEQLLNARCVAAQGAGLILDGRMGGGRILAPMLREALNKLLSEARYGEAARTLQQTLRATGGYQQAADEIQGYLA